MLGAPPNMFFKVCWWVISPLLVMIILISSIVQYSPARYGKTYTYPPWAEVLGWFFSLCSIIWIPLGAVHTLYYSEGTLLQVSDCVCRTLLNIEPDYITNQICANLNFPRIIIMV
ncbi:Sodium-dependent proline transporter [Acipenser ruthenus]|uniref:Sodium-dependent proline transporter n=1 Tax=Acipenser ruthenus TaxID=7906 RepID=A0A444USS8_ACIRT|nr:Sodium-dependent proline transporter [Acipenser ruthenus]